MKPTCPSCKKEITELIGNCSETSRYRIEDGSLEQDYEQANPAEYTFDCPECFTTIFWDWEDAETFLKGGGEE